ncbi:MAG TPA: biotin transporter BioY [Candidatus Pelagibacter bacterium]|jgi:biotin transport system substrate-specific component|nr:biotin transporter BioY [Candidatus Pelagibacter bacterium]|tara:strand:+ start:164 stop:715 length:552 start_codon:yes stop_codon:yes gene_type:complete
MELVKTISNNKIIKIFLISLIGSILLTISAKIRIPFYPVPMTMQTFVVLFLGISFGYKVGVTTIFLYLLEGIAGLPVFSNSPEKGIGIAYFVGPTMGYLIGFIFACFLAGYFKYNSNYFINFLKILVSTSVIYFFGVIWLGTLIGWDKPILQLGVFPFLLAEFFKILLLTLLVNKIIRLRKFI